MFNFGADDQIKCQNGANEIKIGGKTKALLWKGQQFLFY